MPRALRSREGGAGKVEVSVVWREEGEYHDIIMMYDPRSGEWYMPFPDEVEELDDQRERAVYRIPVGAVIVMKRVGEVDDYDYGGQSRETGESGQDAKIYLATESGLVELDYELVKRMLLNAGPVKLYTYGAVIHLPGGRTLLLPHNEALGVPVYLDLDGAGIEELNLSSEVASDVVALVEKPLFAIASRELLELLVENLRRSPDWFNMLSELFINGHPVAVRSTYKCFRAVDTEYFDSKRAWVILSRAVYGVPVATGIWLGYPYCEILPGALAYPSRLARLAERIPDRRAAAALKIMARIAEAAGLPGAARRLLATLHPDLPDAVILEIKHSVEDGLTITYIKDGEVRRVRLSWEELNARQRQLDEAAFKTAKALERTIKAFEVLGAPFSAQVRRT